MITISILPKEHTRKISLILFVLSLFGVLLTLIIGLTSGGASRWISIFGIITVQPSEFLKPCLIILSAWFFARSKQENNSKYSLIPGLLFIIVASLLMLQPDLGQTILLFITISCLVFIQGFPWLIIAPAGLISMLTIIFFYFNFPHFASRLDAWIEIWFGGGSVNTKLTQTQAAIDAIENGQIFGKGIGESWVKYHLPDAYTDFVFAAIAEENGLEVLCADATLDETLKLAGLEKCKSLVVTLPNDAANLYVVLSAKGIRSSIRVIARAGTEEAASKLRLAGASIVVSPYIAAGRAMASMALRPIAIDFLDLLAGSECEIEEFELSNDINLFETAEKRSLSELGIGKKSGAKILAIKENEKLVTNPGGSFILQPGQVLIAFGSKEQLNVLNGLLGNLVVAVELLK